MNRFKISITAAVVALLATSFTIASHEGFLKDMKWSSLKAFTCTANKDYIKGVVKVGAATFPLPGMPFDNHNCNLAACLDPNQSMKAAAGDNCNGGQVFCCLIVTPGAITCNPSSNYNTPIVVRCKEM